MAIGTPVSIGTVQNKTGELTTTLTTTATVPTGALIVVCIAQDGVGAGASLSDSVSNTYAAANTAVNTDGVWTSIWYSDNSTSLPSGGTITVDWGGGNEVGKAIAALYCEGIATTSALDKTGTAIGSDAAPLVSTSATTTQADELTIGVVGTEGPSGDTFTQDASPAYATPPVRVGTTGGGAASNITLAGGHFIETTTGVKTYDPTLGTARDWAAVIATFKASGNSVSATASWKETATMGTRAVNLFPITTALYQTAMVRAMTTTFATTVRWAAAATVMRVFLVSAVATWLARTARTLQSGIVANPVVRYRVTVVRATGVVLAPVLRWSVIVTRSASETYSATIRWAASTIAIQGVELTIEASYRMAVSVARASTLSLAAFHRAVVAITIGNAITLLIEATYRFAAASSEFYVAFKRAFTGAGGLGFYATRRAWWTKRRR